MSKLVQRLAAMVAMTAVVLGATIGGVSSMMIHYKPLNEGAETVLTVNGDAVTADEYSGYMLYNMQYYASMYAQMGLTDLWSNEDMAKSLGASMPEAAEQQAIYARVVMQKFNELGLKLSYNEQKEMASVRRNSIANTTKDAYLNQIAQFGFSDQTYQNFMYISQCYQALNDYYFGENGVNTPSDEDIQKYYEDNYITAKHILITTVDPASGETKRTDEEAKKEAQSILDRINAGEDFDTLMNQYSEDTGLSNNPNGYTFTEGQMVTEFYDGAKALAEDEVSELVKSSYGYHIIKRVKLDDSQLDNFKSDIISAISGSMDELQVETTDLYSTITYENVYDYLPQDVQTLVTRPGEASEQSDAQQSDAQQSDAQPSDAEQSATEQSAQ